MEEKQATSPDGPVDHELDPLRQITRWSVGGDILMSTDAAMLTIMVLQPGLVAWLLVVIVISAGVAIARPMRTRKPRLAFEGTA